MRERMMDIERDFKSSQKDRKLTNERLESLETDVSHIMGRGDTSDVSGISKRPLVSLKNTFIQFQSFQASRL